MDIRCNLINHVRAASPPNLNSLELRVLFFVQFSSSSTDIGTVKIVFIVFRVTQIPTLKNCTTKTIIEAKVRIS